jgi:hypothetical protein
MNRRCELAAGLPPLEQSQTKKMHGSSDVTMP